MITERTLRNWRKDALKKVALVTDLEFQAISNPEVLTRIELYTKEINERILRLTQELLDQHLMKGK